MTEPSPSTLFRQALINASKSANLPTIQDSTQDLIQSSLRDLRKLSVRISALSLFSPNETLEDIATRDLVYLFVNYVFAEVQGRVRTNGRAERMRILREGQASLKTFLSNLEDYEIIPEEERKLYQTNASTIADPASRRDLKIKQFKKEKDLKVRIEVVRKKRHQQLADALPDSELDMIASLLPSLTSTPNGEDEEDSETEDALREATLLLLRLTYTQAHAQLVSMDQELALLRSAPASPPLPPEPSAEDSSRRDRDKAGGDDMWKLDQPARRTGDGPLLDPAGKPLRPFTILPSSASDRARLQAQVFQPDHRLPTMSIDEYLEVERQRGNILSGGGAASAAAPTSSEQLALDAEQEGTRAGDEKAEEKRLKDENWARFTDENPKGAGNTMNRG